MGLLRRGPTPAEIEAAARAAEAEAAAAAKARLLAEAARDTTHRADAPTGRIGGQR